MQRGYNVVNAVIFMCLIGTSGIVGGCESQEEEREIQSMISQITEELEQGDVTDLMKLTTKDFVAYPGKTKKWAASKRLMVLMRDLGAVTMLHPALDIDVSDTLEEAVVRFPFVFVPAGLGSDKLDALHDDPNAWVETAKRRAKVHSVELSLVKQGERWRIQTARFQ